MSQALALVGSGPGIDFEVASLFAARKFDAIALILRDSNRLEDGRREVLNAAQNANGKVEVKTWAADITGSEFKSTLKRWRNWATSLALSLNRQEYLEPTSLTKCLCVINGESDAEEFGVESAEGLWEGDSYHPCEFQWWISEEEERLNPPSIAEKF
ncbi:hypothetical protein BDZ45DRAFT_743591 [Acephala macrosclerotiorum]|nr:hypothetical protein BDZ45DRAFT_743591 [Acephala macrosclerotiorum]